jgi:hypothetical protein
MKRLPAADMADTLSSGLSGLELVQLLHTHFPNITREEAFTACGIAALITQADLMMLELELAGLRRQVKEDGHAR